MERPRSRDEGCSGLQKPKLRMLGAGRPRKMFPSPPKNQYKKTEKISKEDKRSEKNSHVQ